jgi:hypothetical protein
VLEEGDTAPAGRGAALRSNWRWLLGALFLTALVASAAWKWRLMRTNVSASRDGDRAVFVSTRSGGQHIWMKDLRSGSRRTASKWSSRTTRVSPTSASMVVSSRAKGPGPLAGTSKRELYSCKTAPLCSLQPRKRSRAKQWTWLPR